MNIEKNKRRKVMKIPSNPKIVKREVVTDQSDPRMIKFKKERGEFEPGYHQGNTVKLQITEYEAGLDEYQVDEIIGFVDGAPSLFEIPLFREFAEKAILKVNEEHEREKWAEELHISFRDYRRRDRKAVLELWKLCKLIQPWEEPAKHINQRIKVHPDLFLVCWTDGGIIAAVMGRCDENRGWVEYLAVHPSFRKKGIGRQLVKIIEDRLHKKGCSEISILIDPDKAAAIEFARRAGYGTKNLTLMRKSLRDG
jgi:ribosomal protein S18 acetylase RimI-like enzyme